MSTSTPEMAVLRRTRLQLGFGLCCAFLALWVAVQVGGLAVPYLAGSAGIEWLQADGKSFESVAGIAIESVLVAGLVCLCSAATSARWRRTASILLAMAGVDLTIYGLAFTGGSPDAVAFGNVVGSALGWVELWLLAVLAADAAESLERPEITYQTELIGRLIVWGGFVWAASRIWLYPMDRASESASPAYQSEFAEVLGLTAAALQVFALVRLAICCGGLASAYSATVDERPPAKPA